MPNKDIFVKQDSLTQNLEELIKNENKRRNFARNNEVYTPVQITECPRRIIYRSRGTKVEENSSFQQEIIRDNAKLKWISILASLSGIKIKEKDLVVADCNYNLTGTVDAVLQIEDAKYILLVKTLSQEEYTKVNKDGAIKKHIIELMMLMWLIEIKDGILLYENKNTQDVNIFHILPYKAIITSAKNKCLKLLGNQLKGTIPIRPYDSKDNRECMVCEYQSICWEQKRDE